MNLKDLHKDIKDYYKEFKLTIRSATEIDSVIVCSVNNAKFGDWHAMDSWVKYGKTGYVLKGRVTILAGKVV
jgi:hypothetical protein